MPNVLKQTTRRIPEYRFSVNCLLGNLLENMINESPLQIAVVTLIGQNRSSTPRVRGAEGSAVTLGHLPDELGAMVPR